MEKYYYSSNRTNNSKTRVFSNYFQKRSLSPSGRFCCYSPGGFLTRPTSPSRVNLHQSKSSAPSSIRFSTSPGRSINKTNTIGHNNNNNKKNWSSKKTCMCSPTTHPGSFRCSLRKSVARRRHGDETASYRSHGLDARRSAMTNSLVMIGTVEGDLVKRALAALIRPSSHQLKRRDDFRPRPSRLSVMYKPPQDSDH